MGTDWAFAMDDDRLQENSMSFAYPKGLPIILIRKEGRLYAVANKCAHMACPLGGGTLEGYTIKCPCHDWKFDVRTGEFLSAKELKIATFPVKLAEGKIFVGLEQK